MPELNWLAVVVAAVVIFVVSSLYYMVVAARLVDLTPPEGTSGGGLAPWKMGVELIRNLVLATVVGGLASLLGITDLAGGLQLGVVLWVGFPMICSAPSSGRTSNRCELPPTPATGC